jgi:hypothetical protein
MKKELKRGGHGYFAEGDKPAMEKKGIPFDSQLLHDAEHFQKEFDLSSMAETVRALMRLGMESIGFPHVDMEPELTRKIHAKLDKGKYNASSIAGDGNNQVVNSSINATAADEAMSATQIGNSNRNVNVKKNHAQPSRTSKRRK